MKVYDATSIRNVAVVGHGGCGKTQLVSAMLFAAGMVNRLGRVDDGTTVTDYDPEEIARKHTLSTSLAYAEWRKTKINLLDTPGVANFFADARAALRVADAAHRRRRRGVGPGGADREGLGRRRRAGAAADRRAQPVRSRPRLARTHHRRAAPHLPSQRDAGPPADRRGRGLHRPGRRRRHEGVHRAGRRRPGGRGADPRGPGRRGPGGPHRAHRGGRRGRRGPDGALLRRRARSPTTS